MNDLNQIHIFDRRLVRRHRDRAAENFVHHYALFDETAAQLIERFEDIKHEFRTALDLGAHSGQLAHILQGKIPFVVAADISEKMLRFSNVPSLVADEEFLPFAANSFDLIVSNLSLHWVNDLPGALIQIRNALRPKGLFLASLLGGETLYELRNCFVDAELSIAGGVSPRLSPVIELQTASALLQRAGFILPVADAEKITLTYSDAFALMKDLRGMGETNALVQRLRRPTRRAIFMEAARLYQQRFCDTNGRIQASFEILYLHGTKA